MSRRIVFQGLGALGVAAALAGCGGGDNPSGTDAGGPAPKPATPGHDQRQPQAGSQSGPEALASTAEIPVGGGLILTGPKIVITQPTQGEFKAFTAVCTHEGNTVTSVEDGTIMCAFHGSQYDAETGQVTQGPAPTALAPVKITVRGGQILSA